MKHNLINEDGYSLAGSVFMITLLTLMGFTMVILIDNNSRITTTEIQSARAFYIGQAAIEYGVRKSFINQNWRWTEKNISMCDGISTIIVQDSVNLPALRDTVQVTVTASYQNAGSRQQIRMKLMNLSQYAVYISGNLNDVTVRDSAGTPNPSLMCEFATEMPEMDINKLKQTAIAQGHYFSGNLSLNNRARYPTLPDTGFYHRRPNGVVTDTPNVVFIEGNLEVKNSASITGIIVVNGDVVLKNSQRLVGVLYLPDPLSVVQQVDLDNKESIYGGIFGGTNVEGNGNVNNINIFYRNSYITQFFGHYSVNGLPYVTIWRRWKQF